MASPLIRFGLEAQRKQLAEDRGALLLVRDPLDIAPPISLRFPNYFAMRFGRGAKPLRRPPHPMRILLCMRPNPQFLNAARDLMGPNQLKGNVR